MSYQTIYLITGANRGIGLGLTSTLLFRPETLVIATVRSASTATTSLTTLPRAAGSNLLIFTLSAESDTDAEELVAKIRGEGVQRIDVIIANAGGGDSFQSILKTPIPTLRTAFETNTLGPIKLYQALHPLLTTSRPPSSSPDSPAATIPKFILISSSLGSIGDMEGSIPSLAYGVSKAGANYLVRKVHFEGEREGIVGLGLHPGWVKTENGQNFADSIGVQSPPMTLEESVAGVLKQIDGATRETTSGSFVSYDGSILKW